MSGDLLAVLLGLLSLGIYLGYRIYRKAEQRNRRRRLRQRWEDEEGSL